jgi:hypothetical protein
MSAHSNTCLVLMINDSNVTNGSSLTRFPNGLKVSSLHRLTESFERSLDVLMALDML